MQFEFGTATRIIFGVGGVQKLGALVEPLGRRVLLVTGAAERAAPVREQLAACTVQVIAVRQEPTVAWLREALVAARKFEAEVVIGVGGGSALDAGKALAILLTNPGDPLDYLEVIGQGQVFSQPARPYIAIPTTAGTGAEVTQNAVLGSPEHGVKASLRHPLMLPRLALVDPELTLSVPPAVTAYTGLDALTQLIEPFTTPAATPLTDALCREALPRVASALPQAYHHPDDLKARSEMALGALCSGLALANAKLGAVHGLAGPFGGLFNAPHGAICGRLLPYVTGMNIRALREREPHNPALARYGEVARLALGNERATADDLVRWLHQLGRELALAPLGSYGATDDAWDALIERARRTSSMKGNPIALSAEELAEILAGAW